MNTYIKHIIEAFDFENVKSEDKVAKMTQNLKDYIFKDSCEKIRNIFIEKRK